MITTKRYKQLFKKQFAGTATHRELAEMEVYDFVQHPPDSYMLFVKRNKVAPGIVDQKVTVTTAPPALTLGYGFINKFRKVRGQLRYSLRFTAINGVMYKGIYYSRQGYAKVRKVT